MTIELGLLREQMYVRSKGAIPSMQVDTGFTALFQAFLILFGSAYRFYFNESRGVNTTSQVLGFVCWILASVFFIIIVVGLLGGIPDTVPAAFQTDVYLLRLLVLAWVGYPIVSILSRLALISVPENEYLPLVSFGKDIAYAILDVLSKGGLALYAIVRSTWMTAAEEAAEYSAGLVALNLTSSS
jgi:bacteriorhodopsin